MLVGYREHLGDKRYAQDASFGRVKYEGGWISFVSLMAVVS